MPRHPEESLRPCGTKAAYQRHIRRGDRGEQIDLACRLANNRSRNKRHSENDAIYAKVLYRARKELSELHPEEFKELMAKHLREIRKERDA